MASHYNKASFGTIVSIKNANKEEEEKEERILWCNSDSEESDLMHIEQKISNEDEIISPSHTGKSKNFELNWEKILDKAHDVIGIQKIIAIFQKFIATFQKIIATIQTFSNK